MEAMPGQALESKVLCPAPRLDMNPAYPCKVSNDEGVNAIIFIQRIKGFLVFRNFLRVEAVDLCGEGSQLFTGGKIVGNVDAIKPCRLQTYNDKPELMMLV